MALTLTYTRRQLVEMVRTPALFLSLVLTPVAVMLFFIVPFIGDDPQAMTGAAATIVVFAVLLNCTWHFSASTAALRESPWGAYVRTLPVGLAPQMLSNLLAGIAAVVAAIIPVVAVAALFTAATATLPEVLTAVVALLPAVVVFTLLGLAIGYTLTMQQTIGAASLLVLPLAVGGGMFFDPADTPALVATIAPFLPPRGATDLVLAAVTDYAPDPTAVVMLGVWTVALGAVAAWGYRRDEGRRFR